MKKRFWVLSVGGYSKKVLLEGPMTKDEANETIDEHHQQFGSALWLSKKDLITLKKLLSK